MASDYEAFWSHSSFAVVGHTAKKGFPKLTYGGLKAQGREVFPVDPSVDEIDGDQTYPDLSSLPRTVDAVVLETPREDTKEWIRKAADAGIRHVWIHASRDTPEALGLARERGIEVLSGACAVMYVTRGFSYHSLHKWLNQITGSY